MKDAELSDEQRARLEEALARVPYARLLGLELVAAGPGAATFRLETREELTRMEGIMHGGAVVSLADTAAAFAVLTLLGPGQRTVTVDLTVHFLRPVQDGEIRARARVIREGRRLVIISVEVTDGAGDLAATVTTTYVKQG